MATKQVYDFQGTKVRAEDSTKAAALAQEIQNEKGNAPVITADSMSPVSAIKVQPVAPSTALQGLGGAIEAQSTNFTSELDAKAKASEKAKDTSFEALLKNTLGSPGEVALTDQAYKEGVDPAEAELKDINQQILESQRAQKAELEALGSNGALTPAQLAAHTSSINKKYISQQADLSVIQLSRQGKYDSAKAIADRAVAAKLEEQRTKNEALQLMYQENRDQFTKDEQRAFEAAQGERNRTLDMEAYKEKAKYDQIIKENDPLYRAQVSKIKSEIDAGQVALTNPAAGQYTGALNIILGSGKFTKDQKASLIAAVNNGEDPFTVIKNQAKSILGQTGETTLTKYETAQSAMTDLQSQLSQYYAAGGTTNIFSGGYEKVINKLGSVNNPQLVDLATQIQASLQVYRNAVSGTAYSEQEGADIAAIFPGINKTEGLNTAIINGRMKAFDSTIDATYRTALGSTYDQLKQISQAGVKGKQSDADFVENSLSNIGANYDTVLSQVPPGQRAVIDNKTGQVGYIPAGEFDKKLYTSL